MGKYTLIASMAGDGVVVSAGPIHPEEPVEPGEVAPPWNRCAIPDCRHNPCPAKLRAWARYGQRYICREEGCDHRDCAARHRADEDGQAFDIEYDGPALPQHTITPDGEPLGPTLRAIRGADGEWRLAPIDPGFDPIFGESTYEYSVEQRRSIELYLVNLRRGFQICPRCDERKRAWSNKLCLDCGTGGYSKEALKAVGPPNAGTSS